jgi:hypothetical protein
MMIRSKRPTDTESRRLLRRLVSCLPATRFEMETFCRLTNIEVSREVPTAAVDCTRLPRLRINPDFIAQHCPKDEHLFLLVMHEIWHVMLAHTRMHPRMTPAQNVAFDAIINAGLMREFYTPEYMGFFDKINPADKFPSCLLRPPVGWPHNPQYPTELGPTDTGDLLRRLYPPQNDANVLMPMYEEVLDLLIRSGCVKFEFTMLLGNHDPLQMHDPLLKEVMREARSKWKPFKQLEDQRLRLANKHLSVGQTGKETRAVFAQALRLSLVTSTNRKLKTTTEVVMSSGNKTVLPNPRDRLAPARSRLGIPQTLWEQPTTVNVRRWKPTEKAHLYLDVSGSMEHLLPNLIDLVVPYVADGTADVFQFSTEIAPITFEQLSHGDITTTGGTNINCVLEHLLTMPKFPRTVLLVTDGEFGTPQPNHVQRFVDEHIRLFVVMPEGTYLEPTIEGMAQRVIVLPPLY